MVTVIPAIIGVGTVMGSGLRKLSKQAQSQVSRYNSHPSNYRCRNPNKNCLRMCILKKCQQEKKAYTKKTPHALDLIRFL